MDAADPVRGATSERTSGERDGGTVLLLVLLLTTVLGIIVLGLLNYTETGLRTSNVATERTERNAAATAAAYFVVESMSSGSTVSCPASQAVPDEAIPGDVGVSVACQLVDDSVSPARYELTAQTADGHPAGEVIAVIEVRTEMSAPRSVRVVSWSGGI